jgi:hypothetical protein
MKVIIVCLILLIGNSIFPYDDIRVISSDQNSIVIEYSANYIDTSVVVIGSQSYYNINIDYGNLAEPEKWGMPSVAERLFGLGVPAEYGNTIDVLQTEYSELEGLIAPIAKMVPDGNLNKFEYIVGEGYNEYRDNPELVLFGEFGITRGINNQIIRILPVKFDPVQRKIRIYKRIVFRITYSKGGTLSNQPYDELLSSSFINYDVARYWQKERKTLNKAGSNSVLSTGEWVKFETGEEGIYKIDYNFLITTGIDAGSIDPRTIKIYNNGGKVLPENIGTERAVDLVENAITVVGEGDGKFDEGDYILFYGRGTNFWDKDETQGKIIRYHHPYSEKNYYWITYGGENGKRIENKEGLTTPADFVQTSTAAFADYEEDKINIGKTGRQYCGDDFSQTVQSRTYITSLNGVLNEIPVEYKCRFVNASSEDFTLKILENNSIILTQLLPGYRDHLYRVGQEYFLEAMYNGNIADNRSVLKFTITPTSVSNTGYLDYFEISYQKELKAFEDKILFFSQDTSAIIEYYLHNFSSTSIQVYDISDYSNIKLITNHIQLSGGDCRFRIEESQGNISKYYAVAGNNYLSPSNPVSVNNSNLRGIQDGAKYIIISHDKFIQAANIWKDYRENEAPVHTTTIVINIASIINEFSCGNLDPTAIRDFIKYAYDNWNTQPAYVLLLGKGTYDYKNKEGYNDNYIPAYQTIESLIFHYGGDSYTSDDYFAAVDGYDSIIDLAIARVTVTDELEIENYLAKIKSYELYSKKGEWKNRVTLVSDDGLTTNGNDWSAHTAPSETLATHKIPSSFDIKKIYLAEYPAVITGGGRRKPAVNEEIIKTINEGTLILNYIGHGNPEVWAHELVFEKSVTIPKLINTEYFLLVAATCDFAYYDIPNFKSAAEELLLKSDGGAISCLGSSRIVESGRNHDLNYDFLYQLLKDPRDSSNIIKTIGACCFAMKSTHSGVNDRKYHLFGDPLIRLQLPQNEGKIDSINGEYLTADVQIKALSRTSISGIILTPENEIWTDFNGEGILTVFDSERKKHLDEINFNINLQGGIIFRGSVSVINGHFNTNFVVPKDISYENKNGKAIFYYFNETTDGIAFTKQIIVGGTDTTAVDDGEGPEIEIFFDDATMYNAYLVGPEPNLIVQLSDETGLNTTGTGVGHKLEGILDKDESTPIDFTNYFKGELDAGGKAGEINYKFNKMEEGDYHLKVKAWDVFNNYTSEETNFTVVTDEQLVIRDVYNYPNPFEGNTTFTFQHNLTGGVNVRIKVYTISGRLIKEIEKTNIGQKFVKIDWNGRDADGDRISNGTYLYKIIVNTVDGNFSQSVLGKMAVIR